MSGYRPSPPSLAIRAPFSKALRRARLSMAALELKAHILANSTSSAYDGVGRPKILEHTSHRIGLRCDSHAQ